MEMCNVKRSFFFHFMPIFRHIIIRCVCHCLCVCKLFAAPNWRDISDFETKETKPKTSKHPRSINRMKLNIYEKTKPNHSNSNKKKNSIVSFPKEIDSYHNFNSNFQTMESIKQKLESINAHVNAFSNSNNFFFISNLDNAYNNLSDLIFIIYPLIYYQLDCGWNSMFHFSWNCHGGGIQGSESSDNAESVESGSYDRNLLKYS